MMRISSVLALLTFAVTAQAVPLPPMSAACKAVVNEVFAHENLGTVDKPLIPTSDVYKIEVNRKTFTQAYYGKLIKKLGNPSGGYDPMSPDSLNPTTVNKKFGIEISERVSPRENALDNARSEQISFYSQGIWNLMATNERDPMDSVYSIKSKTVKIAMKGDKVRSIQVVRPGVSSNHHVFRFTGDCKIARYSGYTDQKPDAFDFSTGCDRLAIDAGVTAADRHNNLEQKFLVCKVIKRAGGLPRASATKPGDHIPADRRPR